MLMPPNGIVTEMALAGPTQAGQAGRMEQMPDLYRCHRFPGAIISHAIWLYSASA
jgi:hypothetical protein